MVRDLKFVLYKKLQLIESEYGQSEKQVHGTPQQDTVACIACWISYFVILNPGIADKL